MKLAKRQGKTKATDSIGFASPWPEHRIIFDEAAIRAKGYVGVVRDTSEGVKGYRFVKKDGSTRFLRAEAIVILDFAIYA